jgi:hypothetical protein
MDATRFTRENSSHPLDRTWDSCINTVNGSSSHLDIKPLERERANGQISELVDPEEDTHSENFEWLLNKAFKQMECVNKTRIPAETSSIETVQKLKDSAKKLINSTTKESADIAKLIYEFLSTVQSGYLSYVENTEHGDFRQFKKEALEGAKDYNKKIGYINEAMAYLALHKLKTMDSYITDTSEFKTIRYLLQHQAILADDIEDINKARKEIQTLVPSSASQSITPQNFLAKVKACWEKIAGVMPKQISIANQRLTEIEENIERHGKMADKYEEAKIHDVPSQAKQRAEQAKKRAGQAKKLAEKTIKTVDRVTKLIKQSVTPSQEDEKIQQNDKHHIIDMGSVKKAAEHAKELLRLELNIAEIASLSAKSVIEQETKGKAAPKDSDSLPLQEEQKYWEREKDALSQAIKNQDEMIASLKQLKDELEKKPGENKQKSSDDTASSPADPKTNDEAEIHSETLKYWREIKLVINDAEEESKELKKLFAEHDKVSKHYNMLKSNSADLDTQDNEMRAMQARNLAVQYDERARQTKARAKQYEKRLKWLKACGADEKAPEGASPWRWATQIAHLEHKIKEEYLKIANNPDTTKPSANGLTLSTAKPEKYLKMIKDLYERERGALTKIEDAEKNLVESARKDRNALNKLGAYFDILESSTEEDVSSANIGKLLKSLRNHLVDSSLEKATDHNLRFMQYKKGEVSEQAGELIKKMGTVPRDKNIQNIVDLSEAHMMVDAENSGMTVINGVCMYTREIRSIKVDKERGATTIIFREDIPEVRIFDQQREYSKRLSSIEINTNDRTLKIEAPGDTYRRPGEERNKWYITDNNGTKEYDAKSLHKVSLFRHEKEQGNMEISYNVQRKTMPDDTYKHDDLVTCYTPENLANMHRFNLKTGKYIAPDNQLTADLADFDFTEVMVDGEHGLVLVGEWEFYKICPKYVGKMSNFLPDLKKVEEELKAKKIKYDNECISLLNDARLTSDRQTIKKAFAALERNNSILSSFASATAYQLKRPPKGLEEFKWLKEAPSNSILNRISVAHKQDAEALIKANNDLNNSLTTRVKTILTNGSDEKDKQKLLHEIYAAYHLDRKFDFPLLVDPTKGREIKCSQPNMLMLTEEYNMYMDKKHAKKGGISQDEQQYVTAIEKFVSESDDDYLKNEICLIKANRSENDKDAFNALKENLNGGHRSPHPDMADSTHDLQNLRQNAEYCDIEYLTQTISRANAEGIYGLIRQSLGITMHMRQSRYETLKHVEKALNPDTPVDVAQRAIDKMPEQLPPSLAIVDKDEQDHDKVFDELKADVERCMQDLSTKNANAADYIKNSVDLSAMKALITYKKMLDAFSHEPVLKREMEEHAVKLIKHLEGEYLKQFNTTAQYLHFKEVKKLMLHWFMISLLFSGVNTAVTQTEGHLNRINLRLMNFLIK